jgi:hypothetical protein
VPPAPDQILILFASTCRNALARQVKRMTCIICDASERIRGFPAEDQASLDQGIPDQRNGAFALRAAGGGNPLAEI